MQSGVSHDCRGGETERQLSVVLEGPEAASEASACPPEPRGKRVFGEGGPIAGGR